jgi:hypothetical protein
VVFFGVSRDGRRGEGGGDGEGDVERGVEEIGGRRLWLFGLLWVGGLGLLRAMRGYKAGLYLLG